MTFYHCENGIRQQRYWSQLISEEKNIIGDTLVADARDRAGPDGRSHCTCGGNGSSANKAVAQKTPNHHDSQKDSAATETSSLPPTDVDCLNVYSVGLTLPNGRRLLNDVSFTARPGSLTAIIGPSGAGKTTLAKLVGGALTPTTGEIGRAHV